MQKLMRNWIFTLVVCILLAMFAVLLLLDNLGVTGEKYIAYQVIHVMTAVALAIYVILALCPMVPRYRGAAIPFLLFEIVMLSITAIAQLGVQFFRDIPWISDMAVCSVLGFALWLRAAILLVRAYLLQARQPKNSEKKEEEKNTEKTTEKPAKKKKKVVTHTPLWQFCLYIIVAAIGVWQMVKPLISDHAFIYYIAAAAALFAALFAVATVQNRRALPKKEKKATKTAEEPTQPVVVAPVAELSTSATEEPAQPAAEPPVIESPKTEKE